MRPNGAQRRGRPKGVSKFRVRFAKVTAMLIDVDMKSIHPHSSINMACR